MLKWTVLGLLLNVSIIYGQGSINEEVTQISDSLLTSTTADTSKLDSASIKDTLKTKIAEITDTIAPVIDTVKIDTTAKISESAQNKEIDSTDKALTTQVTQIPEQSSKKTIYGGRSGLGLNMGVKIFYPKEVNDYLEDIFDGWLQDAPGNVIDTPYFVGFISTVGLQLKGIIYFGSIASIEPFGFANFGMKLLRFSSDGDILDDHKIDISLLESGGGVNFWARISPHKKVSFKAGLGGYVSETIINLDSYAGEVTLSGIGYGINILSGFDITFRKIAINIDFSIPLGVTADLDSEGSFNKSSSLASIKYPKRYVHTGLEIKPGITFQF